MSKLSEVFPGYKADLATVSRAIAHPKSDQSTRDALFRIRVQLDTDKEIIESQAKDLHRLLTGLEALAGEVRRIQARAKRRPDDDGADRKRNLYRVAKLLTLTNSAKDGA